MKIRSALAILAIGLFLCGSVHGTTAEDRPRLEAIAGGPIDSPAQKDAAARAHYELGDLDERALAYESALGHYRAVLAIDPANWYATTARARIGTLEHYEGAFDALRALDLVRKNPNAANDANAVATLADEAKSFPPVVRDEALLFAAESFVGRLHDPARAIEPAMIVAHDANGSPLDRATAFEVGYDAMRSVGATDRIRTEILGDSAAPPALVARARRQLRRHVLDRAADVVVGVGVAALLVGAIEAVRRKRARVLFDALRSRAALGFLALVVGGGWLVAEFWEKGRGAPFVVFGATLLAVHALASAWRGGFGDRRRALRVVGGAIAAACVVACAWRVLEHGGAKTSAMLEEVGL